MDWNGEWQARKTWIKEELTCDKSHVPTRFGERASGQEIPFPFLKNHKGTFHQLYTKIILLKYKRSTTQPVKTVVSCSLWCWQELFRATLIILDRAAYSGTELFFHRKPRNLGHGVEKTWQRQAGRGFKEDTVDLQYGNDRIHCIWRLNYLATIELFYDLICLLWVVKHYLYLLR